MQIIYSLSNAVVAVDGLIINTGVGCLQTIIYAVVLMRYDGLPSLSISYYDYGNVVMAKGWLLCGFTRIATCSHPMMPTNRTGIRKSLHNMTQSQIELIIEFINRTMY